MNWEQAEDVAGVDRWGRSTTCERPTRDRRPTGDRGLALHPRPKKNVTANRVFVKRSKKIDEGSGSGVRGERHGEVLGAGHGALALFVPWISATTKGTVTGISCGRGGLEEVVGWVLDDNVPEVICRGPAIRRQRKPFQDRGGGNTCHNRGQ